MPKSITIYGASDDLLEVEGAISEEFGVYGEAKDDEPFYVAVSDGTLLEVRYDGCWRLAQAKAGSCAFSKTEGDPDGDYTDRITLTGDALSWVVVGTKLARAGK